MHHKDLHTLLFYGCVWCTTGKHTENRRLSSAAHHARHVNEDSLQEAKHCSTKQWWCSCWFSSWQVCPHRRSCGRNESTTLELSLPASKLGKEITEHDWSARRRTYQRDVANALHDIMTSDAGGNILSSPSREPESAPVDVHGS